MSTEHFFVPNIWQKQQAVPFNIRGHGNICESAAILGPQCEKDEVTCFFYMIHMDLLAFFFLFEAHSHPCGASIKPAASSIVHMQPLEISQQISLKFKGREKNSINYCNI
jgi:hypothetical protein